MIARLTNVKCNRGVANGAGLALAFALACTGALAQSDPLQSQQSATVSVAAAQSGAPPADPSADPPDDSTESMFPHLKDTRFWLSGQSNFIFQTHPEFHALYSGVHSLGPHYDKATSRVLTLYTGVRLNNSTEVLVDIEEAGRRRAQRRFRPGRRHES